MPEQERAHDQLAEPELLRHDHPYLSRGYAQHSPGRGRHRAEIDPLASEQSELTQELAGAVRRDDRLPRLADALDNLHLAVKDHNQVVGLVAVGKQHITGGDVVLAAVPAEDVELRRIQDRPTTSLGRLRGCLALAEPGCRIGTPPVISVVISRSPMPLQRRYAPPTDRS